MVQIYKILLSSAKKVASARFRTNFIDTLRLTVTGGHGGNGLPKYGGVGGQGGCVYCVATEASTLKNVAQKLKDKRVAASSGQDSSKLSILGRRGVDERIEVPLGVQVIDDKGKVLADLNVENETCVVAGGGVGGCSGTNFLGRPGESRTINLDLKLIADVGLVGFPNAGKSTFLKAISNAKPKIASYPFTTIRPQIGTVEYSDLRSISVADLPGLIEGAHANFGMGHKFLKHIERTRLLLFIVDISGFRLSSKHQHRNCIENIYALNKELEMYDKTLLDKPCILLVNKMDRDDAKDTLRNIKPILQNLEEGLDKVPEDVRPQQLINFKRILPISAKNQTGIPEVLRTLRQQLDESAESEQVVDNKLVRETLQQKIGERGPRVT